MADLYAAVSDKAVNHVVRLVRAQAPYLFNYVAPTATPIIDESGNFLGTREEWLACVEVPPPPPNVPRYRRIPPFQLPGVGVKLPFAIHVEELAIDFHPGGAVELPPELGPELGEQRFALSLGITAGLPCVPAAAVDFGQRAMMRIARLSDILMVNRFHSFTVRAVVVGSLAVETQPGGGLPVQRIRLELRGLEIVDVAPAGLEQAIECYLVAVLQGAVLPGLALALQQLPVGALGLTAVQPVLSSGLPHNPAIEQDELRLWLDLVFT